MFKINQKIRNISVAEGIDDLSYAEIYRVKGISGNKVAISYLDGYQTDYMKRKMFDCSNFYLMPNKHEYKIGQKVFVQPISKYSIGQNELNYAFENNYIKPYHRYEISHLHPINKDRVQIKDARYRNLWVYIHFLTDGAKSPRIPNFL